VLPSLPERRWLLRIIGGFFVFGFLVYGWSLNNAFVRWDDGLLITENPIIREISGPTVKAAFTHFDPELYIPLTFLSYQLDYQIGGTDPTVYHVHNLILHILNALLTAWLLFLLLKRPWLALLGGLLFLLHPLQTEAVAWASARKDVLSTFFFLGSAIAYLFHRESDRRRTYWMSVALFLLALLSKVVVVTLPVVLVLFDALERRKWWSMKALMEKLPYLGLSVIFGIVAIVGKQSLLESTSLWEKVLMAAKSTVFYLEKFIWPAKLSVIYPYTGTITLSSPDFWVPAFLLLILAGLAFWSWKRSRAVSLGAAFFLLTLLPTFTNFAKAGDYYIASDRYAYIPLIGLLLVMLTLAGWAWDRFSRSTAGGWTLLTVGVVVLAGLGVKAGAQSMTWKDTDTLFRHVVATYPNSHVAHNNLANAYRRQNKLDDAVGEFRKALGIRQHPKTLSNLGAVFRKQGKFREAFATYNQALGLDPTNPEALVGLGLVHLSQGDTPKALEAYTKAVDANPTSVLAYVNRGALYLDANRVPEAVADLEKAVQVGPLVPEAHENLAIAYVRQGKVAEATEQYEETVKLNGASVSARTALGVLYAKAGKLREAEAQFRAILTLDPENAAARSALQQLQAAGR